MFAIIQKKVQFIKKDSEHADEMMRGTSGRDRGKRREKDEGQEEADVGGA